MVTGDPRGPTPPGSDFCLVLITATEHSAQLLSGAPAEFLGRLAVLGNSRDQAWLRRASRKRNPAARTPLGAPQSAFCWDAHPCSCRSCSSSLQAERRPP